MPVGLLGRLFGDGRHRPNDQRFTGGVGRRRRSRNLVAALIAHYDHGVPIALKPILIGDGDYQHVLGDDDGLVSVLSLHAFIVPFGQISSMKVEIVAGHRTSSAEAKPSGNDSATSTTRQRQSKLRTTIG